MLPVNTIITKIIEETPNIRTFFFDTYFKAVPGQFMMIWIRGVDEIPMALSYENGITVQKVGPATSALFELEVGDSIGIRGPFGNGFEIKDGHILLIAAGVGAAPLGFLAERAKNLNINVTTLLGARNKNDLLFQERFNVLGKLKIAISNGHENKYRYVSELLEEPEDYSQIYCCGPEPMMKDILDRIDPSKTQFSIQRYIKCGIGLCGACCINGLYVCRDGPVFLGDLLKDSEFGVWTRDKCGRKVKI